MWSDWELARSVATNLYNALVDDPQRDAFKLPGFLADLIEKGHLGSKTRQGCYKENWV